MENLLKRFSQIPKRFIKATIFSLVLTSFAFIFGGSSLGSILSIPALLVGAFLMLVGVIRWDESIPQGDIRNFLVPLVSFLFLFFFYFYIFNRIFKAIEARKDKKQEI